MSVVAKAVATVTRETREALLPKGTDVRLSNGQTVTVRPWSIRLLIEMSVALPERFQAVIDSAGSGAKVVTALPMAIQEAIYIVSRTLGVTESEVTEKDWTADDLFAVSEAVVDTCMVPLAEKVMGLVTRLQGKKTATLTPTTGPSQPPSST